MESRIELNPITGCELDQIEISGKANFTKHINDHLVIYVNDKIIFQTITEPTEWSIKYPVKKDEQYRIEAVMYDAPNDNQEHQEFSGFRRSDYQYFNNTCSEPKITTERVFHEPPFGIVIVGLMGLLLGVLLIIWNKS